MVQVQNTSVFVFFRKWDDGVFVLLALLLTGAGFSFAQFFCCQFFVIKVEALISLCTELILRREFYEPSNLPVLQHWGKRSRAQN